MFPKSQFLTPNSQMTFEITIRITPREGLLDPEGKAVLGALHSLGFEGVETVRAGRLLRMRLAAASEDEARARADEMCGKLLANPVTEDYAVEVGPHAGAGERVAASGVTES